VEAPDRCSTAGKFRCRQRVTFHAAKGYNAVRAGCIIIDEGQVITGHDTNFFPKFRANGLT
jgi:hypothetical protein